MSYRTFKRLLGETSLERKCRFLFGGGLLLLIAGSFWFYGGRTARLVYDQNRITGQLLVPSIIVEKHWMIHEETFDPDDDFLTDINAMAKDVKPVELKDHKWDLLKVTSDDPESRAGDQAEFD